MDASTTWRCVDVDAREHRNEWKLEVLMGGVTTTHQGSCKACGQPLWSMCVSGGGVGGKVNGCEKKRKKKKKEKMGGLKYKKVRGVATKKEREDGESPKNGSFFRKKKLWVGEGREEEGRNEGER